MSGFPFTLFVGNHKHSRMEKSMSNFTEILERMDANIKSARQVRQAFKKLEPMIDELSARFPGIYISSYGDWASAGLYNQSGFTSCDNPELLDALEFIEDYLPFRRSIDYPAEKHRTYEFGNGKFTFHLTVWLADDATCKRVITGYEEVEQEERVVVKVARPVYEFKC